MSFYLSLDTDKEIKQRIKNINQIKERLIDMKAEYNELIECNPLVKSRGAGDYISNSSTGGSVDHVIAQTMRKDSLILKIVQYQSIVKDFDEGWELLTAKEKEILSMRYIDNKNLNYISKQVDYSVKQIMRIENEALRKLRLHMTVY